MRVICCTMFSPSHQELADISVPNFQEYADRHGYELRVINIENDKWEYKKHEAFKKWMDNNECDLIFYKDVDSIITNQSIPIKNFLDQIHCFYITRDFTELNGGAIIIKKNKDGRKLNDCILANKKNYGNEQNLFNADWLAEWCEGMWKWCPQWWFNSYSYGLYPECKEYMGRHELGDWEEGDFVIHFPALQLKDRIEMMKEFSQKVIR